MPWLGGFGVYGGGYGPVGGFGPVGGGYDPPETDAVDGPSIMDALAFLVESARLVAVIVTSTSWLTEPGATYSPFVMEPMPCATDHMTCWLGLPVTDATNCWDCPATRYMKDGETEMERAPALEVPAPEPAAAGDRIT